MGRTSNPDGILLFLNCIKTDVIYHIVVAHSTTVEELYKLHAYLIRLYCICMYKQSWINMFKPTILNTVLEAVYLSATQIMASLMLAVSCAVANALALANR